MRLAPSKRAMCEGGPLCLWSPSKTTLTPMGYAQGGFVGCYVCGSCLETSSGVYLVREEQKWLCGPCKSKVQPSGKGRKAVSPVEQLGGDLEQDGRP
jgi:hypothetical protein